MDQLWHHDVRVLAAGLVAIGAIGGWWLPFGGMILITALILVFSTALTSRSNYFGETYFILGTAVCLGIPMWVFYILRWALR